MVLSIRQKGIRRASSSGMPQPIVNREPPRTGNTGAEFVCMRGPTSRHLSLPNWIVDISYWIDCQPSLPHISPSAFDHGEHIFKLMSGW